MLHQLLNVSILKTNLYCVDHYDIMFLVLCIDCKYLDPPWSKFEKILKDFDNNDIQFSLISKNISKFMISVYDNFEVSNLKEFS